MRELLESVPLVAVDVGAARGVPGHWRPFLDLLRIDAFEPNVRECERLAALSPPNIEWHPSALAGDVGSRDLHVLATPTGSSFFPPAPEFVELFGIPEYSEVVEVERLECTTLSAHLERSTHPGLHLIKLDTQGSELEILRGLRQDQFEHVQAIEVEVELHEAYSGQPLFPEVHEFLLASGLMLLDFRVQRAHLTGGTEELRYLRRDLDTAVGTRKLTAQAHAVDALYVRPLHRIAALDDEVAIARALTIFQIYRYFDGIFWLLENAPWARRWGPMQLEQVKSSYRRDAPRPTFLQRTGFLPHSLRRARRLASHLLEEVAGRPGFDPPPVAWTRAYWPDQ